MDRRYTDKRDMRKRSVQEFQNILNALADRHNVCLQPNELAAHHVKIEVLDLETGKTSDKGSIFAKPFSKKEFDKLFEDEGLSKDQWPLSSETISKRNAAYTVILSVHGYLAEQQCPGTLASHSPWSQREVNRTSPFETLKDLTPNAQWFCETILEPQDHCLPHIACVLNQKHPPGLVIDNESLLLSELSYGVAAMAGRTILKRYRKHTFFPVLIYSYIGPKARVIQMHYEHSQVVVHISPFMDFETFNPNALKIMLRWVMNTPMGQNVISTKQADELPVRLSKA